MSYDDADRPGMREAWQVTDWRKRAAELEEEVKAFNDAWRDYMNEGAKPEKVRRSDKDMQSRVLSAFDALAAYDARKGTDEVPKVR